jgi:hypothetical protein
VLVRQSERAVTCLSLRDYDGFTATTSHLSPVERAMVDISI